MGSHHFSIRPPNDEVPASVPLSVILGQTSGFVLALAGLSVYSNGFGFSIHLFLQDHSDVDILESWTAAWRPPDGGSDFEVHIEYDDGMEFWLHPHRAPHPVGHLVFTRGSSEEGHAAQTAFVSPLPPEGHVSVTSDWPSQGLSGARAEFDASLVLDAVGSVIQLGDFFRRSGGPP
jgi:hypothetical protein